jgi:diaminohydroxyphosphoribosylaminopyrimidine deaminase/5-amino-6-(5-phosphoribosylamino)uracil reductase
MTLSREDEIFMKMALRLALKAKGRTSPNPLVGAVIVKDGEVVGRGYHKKAGTPHAEVNAIADAGKMASGATIYVTLEPCNHQGRTPPCTKAILAAGLSRVVVGMNDPNPLVAGGGCKYLASHGVNVLSGVLEEQCRAINRPFVKLISTAKPWVIMKAGLSLDGRIAASSGKPGWITNEKSRRYVHRLRDQVDGILIGIGTALADDPSLTTRLPGRAHRDPVRIVLDAHLRLPASAKMLQQGSQAATLVFHGPDASEVKKNNLLKAGAVPVEVPLANNGSLDLAEVLLELGRRQMSSILVEGGSKVHASFLGRGMVDQVNLFFGPLFIGGDGIPVASTLGLDTVEQARRLKDVSSRRFDDDVMIEGYF